MSRRRSEILDWGPEGPQSGRAAATNDAREALERVAFRSLVEEVVERIQTDLALLRHNLSELRRLTQQRNQARVEALDAQIKTNRSLKNLKGAARRAKKNEIKQLASEKKSISGKGFNETRRYAVKRPSIAAQTSASRVSDVRAIDAIRAELVYLEHLCEAGTFEQKTACDDYVSSVRRELPYYTYYTQQDNEPILNSKGVKGSKAWERTCNVTSFAIIAENLGRTSKDFFARFTSNERPRVASVLSTIYGLAVGEKTRLGEDDLTELRLVDFAQLVMVYIQLSSDMRAVEVAELPADTVISHNRKSFGKRTRSKWIRDYRAACSESSSPTTKKERRARQQACRNEADRAWEQRSQDASKKLAFTDVSQQQLERAWTEASGRISTDLRIFDELAAAFGLVTTRLDPKTFNTARTDGRELLRQIQQAPRLVGANIPPLIELAFEGDSELQDVVRRFGVDNKQTSDTRLKKELKTIVRGGPKDSPLSEDDWHREIILRLEAAFPPTANDEPVVEPLAGAEDPDADAEPSAVAGPSAVEGEAEQTLDARLAQVKERAQEAGVDDLWAHLTSSYHLKLPFERSKNGFDTLARMTTANKEAKVLLSAWKKNARLYRDWAGGENIAALREEIKQLFEIVSANGGRILANRKGHYVTITDVSDAGLLLGDPAEDGSKSMGRLTLMSWEFANQVALFRSYFLFSTADKHPRIRSQLKAATNEDANE